MSNVPYLTTSVETFKKYWTLMMAAMVQSKAIRNYEEYVLLEGRREHDVDIFTMRVAHEMGGLRVVLRGDDKPAVVTLGATFSLAIKIDVIAKILPFLRGDLRIEPVPNKKALVAFVSGTVRNELQFSEGVAEDFPGEQLFDQEEMIAFRCEDFDRRLRLALGSASRDAKAVNSWSAAVFVSLEGKELSLTSAGPTRGVSQVRWEPLIRESVPTFAAVIPLASVHILARAAAGYKGDILVRGDPGNGQLVWEFGHMAYQCRSMGEKYFAIAAMFEGTNRAEASIPSADFANILGLICAQAKDGDTSKATLAFQEDGTVQVTSPSTVTAIEATLNGMCGGVLPHMLTLNADQVREIMADLKHKEGIIHLQAQTMGAKDYPLLKITAPSDPDFLHIAILIETVVERTKS